MTALTAFTSVLQNGFLLFCKTKKKINFIGLKRPAKTKVNNMNSSEPPNKSFNFHSPNQAYRSRSQRDFQTHILHGTVSFVRSF